MSDIRNLLREKGGRFWAVGPNTCAYEALKIMAEKDIGALLVIEGTKLVGILSERDYARNSIQDERSNLVIPVSDLMTRNVYHVGPKAGLEECMTLMVDKHIRHLPILEGERVLGIVTVGDVGKKIIAEQQSTIRKLGKTE